MEDFLATLLNLLNEMSPYLLLGFIIAGALHAFVPAETYARHLSGTGWGAVVKAALVGVPLPLCSCGVLPTSVSLRRSGASRAASTSFLIATPQTGVDSIAATYSLLGPAFAVIRPIAALVTAVLGGRAVGMNEVDDEDTPYCVDDDCQCHDDCCTSDEEMAKLSFGQKLVETVRYGLFDMIESIGKWLIVGLIVAALITVLVPDGFFAAFAQYPLLNMLVVVALSVPMYVCATGSIPIALSLMLKGMTPGAALVLLMAGPAANFASILVVSKAFGKQASIVYLVSIIVGALGFGALIDYALPAQWFVPNAACAGGCEHHMAGWLNYLCSAVVVLSLLRAVVKKFKKKKEFNGITINEMTKEYKIKGMECNHCRASVEKELSKLEGAESVTVSLENGVAVVTGDVPSEKVRAVIEQLGFENVD